MSGLNITTREISDVTIVDLDGKITIGDTNCQLHEAMRSLVNEGKKNVVLNLKKVDKIDSSGLGEIVAGFSTMRKNDGSLKLVNMSDRVQDLLILTKLLTVFDCFDTEAEAIESFSVENNPDAERTAERREGSASTIY
jgi:anti-sigma B factor antagonist